MSSKKFTTALLAIAGVMTVSSLSTNASAPPSSTDSTTTTTTVATPVVAGCATTVSGATSTTVDEAFINLCDAVLTREDEGYDKEVVLNGATFKCTSIPAGTTTDFNRSFFENRISEISEQVAAWNLAKVSNPNAPWAPDNPPKQSCNFPFTSTEIIGH